MTQAFYKNVLESLCFTVGDDDLITFTAPGELPTPAEVDGKRLVMPSMKRLMDGFTENQQPFHPFSENLARGVSPVLNHLQRTAKILFIYYVVELARSLVYVAAKPELHSDLPPEFADFLVKVSKADETTIKDLNLLLRAALGKHNSIMTMFLKNGGVHDGKKQRRVCTVRFPILEELARARAEGDKPFDAKISNKNIATLEAVFRKIIPLGDDPEEYSAGTNAQFAPYFEVFLRSFTKVATQLNRVVRFIRPLEVDLKPIKLDFVEHLDTLSKYYNQIVPLRGNEGDVPKGTTAEEENPSLPWNEQPAAPKPAPAAQPDSIMGNQQPYQAPAPTQVPTGKMSATDFLNTMRPQQPAYQQQQQPLYATPNYNPYGPAPTPPVSPFLQGLSFNRTNSGGQGGGGNGGGIL